MLQVCICIGQRTFGRMCAFWSANPWHILSVQNPISIVIGDFVVDVLTRHVHRVPRCDLRLSGWLASVQGLLLRVRNEQSQVPRCPGRVMRKYCGRLK